MFDKYTERSRKVMKLSRMQAQLVNGDFISTEHILLAILEEGGGVAAKALKGLGVDLAAVAKEIEKIIIPSTIPPQALSSLPFSPRVKRVLELTTEEACRAGSYTIGTEHILLGLFMEREGVAFQVMDTLGIKEDALRAKIDEVLGPEHKKVGGPVAVPATGPVSMKVWVFKAASPNTPNQGKLYLKGTPAVDVEKISTVLVQGIPAEGHESIAEAIATNSGAIAFMIEILKPE
jgi:ATP-dependent Clp protease ATP-binding subunit ClpA